MGWMDWDIEAERKVLERIVMLLLSLAALADRASGLPAPARLHVLAILGSGEAVARCFVIEMAVGAPLEVDAAACPVVEDAARLAIAFRTLALVLATMLAETPRLRHFPVWAHLGTAALPTPPRKAAGPETCPALPAPDTS